MAFSQNGKKKIHANKSLLEGVNKSLPISKCKHNLLFCIAMETWGGLLL